MIEQILERIAVSLERIAAGVQVLKEKKNIEVDMTDTSPKIDEAAAPEKPKRGRPKKEKAESKVKTETTENVTEKEIAANLRIFVEKNGKEAAVNLLAKYGAQRISQLKTADYSAINDELINA